jgi:hypothetical protein
MKDPHWLEVAHDGQMSRSRQPDIPVRADQRIDLALMRQARRPIQHAGRELSL